MRRRPVILAFALLVMMIFATGCDDFADYHVDNRTGQEFLTWPSFDSCEEISEQSDEGLPEEVVAANGIFDYFDSYAPWIDGVRCIVVATPDRRLVLAAPYEYGGSIAIEEPTEPGITLPEQHNPEDAGWKMALNGNVQWIIFFNECSFLCPLASAFSFWADWSIGSLAQDDLVATLHKRD